MSEPIFDRIIGSLSEGERAEIQRRVAALHDPQPRLRGFTVMHHASGNHWPNKVCVKCRLEAMEVALAGLGRQDLLRKLQ